MSQSYNVAIDARWITATPSGIAVYTRELMRRLPLCEPGWRWNFIFRDKTLQEAVERDCAFPASVKTAWHTVPYGPLSPRSQMRMPDFLRAMKCDLFHSTSFMVPFFAFGSVKTLLGSAPPQDRGCGKCIATIHDAIPLIVGNYAPKSATSRMRRLYRMSLKSAIRSSAFTITGSNASRRDIVSALGLSSKEADSLRTIYDGVSDRFSPAGADESGPSRGFPSASGRKADVVLYVGRLDPYKNVPMLVDAFAILLHETGAPLHLLVIGPDDPRYPEARNHAEYRGIRENVSFIRDATDEELVAAYRNASLLVNPSRYEGFGLPMLEAMKSGTPVICADGGSQPEIAGGAARVVPVDDINALVRAMREILFDKGARAELAGKGIRRAADFSWDKTAAETIALYREALGAPPAGNGAS